MTWTRAARTRVAGGIGPRPGPGPVPVTLTLHLQTAAAAAATPSLRHSAHTDTIYSMNTRY